MLLFHINIFRHHKEISFLKLRIKTDTDTAAYRRVFSAKFKKKFENTKPFCQGPRWVPIMKKIEEKSRDTLPISYRNENIAYISFEKFTILLNCSCS